MKKRGHNYRRIKIHRSYTVEGIASLFDIHKNTLRVWIKDGLQTTDNKRPMLIQGHNLAAFLQTRRVKNKKKCNPGEMYCVKCHAPNAPAGDMADYQHINETIGNLIAICKQYYFVDSSNLPPDDCFVTRNKDSEDDYKKGIQEIISFADFQKKIEKSIAYIISKATQENNNQNQL